MTMEQFNSENCDLLHPLLTLSFTIGKTQDPIRLATTTMRIRSMSWFVSR
jgi:hypothetical protein